MANLDDIIDQLAFGKTAPKPGPVLGLYLSPEVIYISETHLEKGNIVVDHLVRIPVPAPDKAPANPQATGTLNTDFLTDNTKLVALIKQSMGSIKWNSKEVVVTLSHHLGLLRYFTMPAIDRRFWAASVPLEAKKYIPIPFDALSHDYQVNALPPDAANKPRQGALIAVTQRKNLLNVTQLLDQLGLKLLSMEVAPCSVLRVWETMDKARAGKTHLQVHFDGGSIRILLAEKGLPIFFRELFLGKEANLGDQRKVDLAGCVGFAQKQLGAGQLGAAFISGAANLAEWQDAFSKEVGQGVAPLDIPAKLGIKGGDWGGYASIGASLRLLAPTPLTLDLGQVGKISEDERRTARDILLAAGLASLFFGVVGVYRNASYSWRARELDQYKRDAEIEAVFTGKGAADVEMMLKNMRAQAQGASIAVNDTVKMTTLIKEVVDALPENAWLTDITYKNNLVKQGMDGLEVTLRGRAKGPSMASEQDMAFEFQRRLLKQPTVSKQFPDIQVSVTGRPVDVGADQGRGPGANPDVLQKLLEERTSFEVVMKRKKPA